jgi:hypothetical protein
MAAAVPRFSDDHAVPWPSGDEGSVIALVGLREDHDGPRWRDLESGATAGLLEQALRPQH